MESSIPTQIAKENENNQIIDIINDLDLLECVVINQLWVFREYISGHW
jgi:hypothetical protein